ncbi:MAG: hypothetical protein AB7F09_18260 [Parvibaculaceae bacterium]
MILGTAALAFTHFAAPAQGGQKGDANAVTLLVGRATDTDFTQIITEPWTTNFIDMTMLGITISRRLGTLDELAGSPLLGAVGDDISFDLEAGAAYRFGAEEQGEFWTSFYVRYDGFPWNDRIYTTAAVNTGLSLLTQTSDFERDRGDGRTSRVLHNFSPEITFADPDNKNLEFVLRLHHRSGIFGTIDGVSSGSTFVATGIRMRF